MRFFRPRTAALAALCLSFLLPGPAHAQVRPPDFADLVAVYPAGGRQGQAVRVTLTGKHIEGATRLLAGEGVRVRSLESVSATEARAELEVAPDALPGVRPLRLVGPRGVTDPGWFVVGELPEAREQEPNGTVAAAGRLDLPAVANGRLEAAEDVDCYRFRARAGEKLVLAVAAFTLDSQVVAGGRYLDASLTVYDSRGRVVAESDDYTTLDPALEFAPPSDGEYVAEVRDVGYLGHAAGVYRLTVGAVPYPVSVYPAGGRPGETVRVRVSGLNLPADASGEVRVPPQAAPGMRWVAPVPGAAAAVPFLVSEAPEVRETEAGAAPLALLPATLNGVLARPGEEDRFAVDLKAGEGVLADVTAGRVLRAPVDLSLSVRDAAGRTLAQNDDSPFTVEATNNRSDSLSGDPRLEFTAPADGRYTLAVRDLADRGSPHAVYRISLSRLEPGFGLTTWYDNPSVKGPGGTGVLVVLLRRWGGFSGPVRARVSGLPAGWTGSEAVLAAPSGGYAPTSTILTITAPPDAAPGTVASFGIEGTAEIAGRTRTVRAEIRAHLGQNADHSIFRATGTALACVTPTDEFTVRAETPVVEAKPGETVRVGVTVQRQAGFTGTVALLPLRGHLTSFGPPVTLPEAAGRAELTLPVPRELPPGDHPFVLCRPIYGDLRSDRPHTSTPVLFLRVRGEAKG